MNTKLKIDIHSRCSLSEMYTVDAAFQEQGILTRLARLS